MNHDLKKHFSKCTFVIKTSKKNKVRLFKKKKGWVEVNL